MAKCKCGCGTVIKGHPNKKFHNKKHKDRYWNRVNPRGFYAPKTSIEPEDIENDMHPLDSYSLGQD